MTKIIKQTASDYECLVLYPSDWYCAILDRRLIKALIKLRKKHGSSTIRSMLDRMDLYDSGIYSNEHFEKIKQNRLRKWDEIQPTVEEIIKTEE